MSAEKHSLYGPSAAEKWLNCPGSIQAEEQMPEQPESVYANEGSAAHHLAEICLNENKPTINFLGCLFHEFPENPVDQEMVDCIQEYVDYVRSVAEHNYTLEIEQKVSYEEYVPGGFGTADAIITVDDVLHVIDLKYGKGIKVYAEDNPQGKLYALGALLERNVFQDFSNVVIHIYQPRLEHVSSWETTPDALYEWAEYVKLRAKLCTAVNPERIPGEKQCQWCLAKPTCYALANRTENALMTQFDEMTTTAPPLPESLRDEDLRFILNQKTLITSWLKSVEDYVKQRIIDGGTFDGFKMVHGRSTRKWSDEVAAEKLLKKLLKTKAYTKKLLTAPQAEKALGKEGKAQIQDLIVKPEGAPTLVPEDDKRPGISNITANDF